MERTSRSPAKRSASRERSFDNAIASEPRLKHPANVQRIQKRRPDKAFMPPSGTTAGMELEVSCPAALRLPGLGGSR
ncbi:hypothetical protein ACT3OG_003705, partial [Klebsiella quasipneumoniae]